MLQNRIRQFITSILSKGVQFDNSPRLLGRISGGPGPAEEIELGEGIDFDEDGKLKASGGGGLTPEQEEKLNGVATGATANSTDAQLRDRATHTGTQGTSTISGLDAALAARVLTADIVDALNSSAADKPLSAAQGKNLQDLKAPKASPQFTGLSSFTNSASTATLSVTNTNDGGSGAITADGGINFLLVTTPQPFMYGSADGWATSAGAVRKMIETRSRAAIQIETAPVDPTSFWDGFWMSPSRPSMRSDQFLWGHYYYDTVINGKESYINGEVFPGTPYARVYWSGTAWEATQLGNSRLWRKVGGTGNLDSTGTWTLVSGGTAPGGERPQITFETLTPGQIIYVADELYSIRVMGFGSTVQVPILDLDGNLQIEAIIPEIVPPEDIGEFVPLNGEICTLSGGLQCVGDGIKSVSQLPWRGVHRLVIDADNIADFEAGPNALVIPINADVTDILVSVSLLAYDYYSLSFDKVNPYARIIMKAPAGVYVTAYLEPLGQTYPVPFDYNAGFMSPEDPPPTAQTITIQLNGPPNANYILAGRAVILDMEGFIPYTGG